MSVHTRCLVVPGLYRDSVVLMQMSHTLQSQSGVRQAAVMMGAVQNLDLLREAGLLTQEAEDAGPNDLIICVQADALATAEAALQRAETLCMQASMPQGEAAETAPRTLATALRRMPDANLVCISVPGQYARREAMRALQNGLHVFLFSDHVDLESERELKQIAARQGLLVMGPDCGTAILHGVPLGFANQLEQGPVGLISASGTGLQQVACLLAQRGIGVSHAIGVGGRDLHHQLGAPSMRAALQTLAHDKNTQIIVLISKPPDAAVARRLIVEAEATGKPCVLALVGWVEPFASTNRLYAASTLEAAALTAAHLVNGEPLWSTQLPLSTALHMQIEAARANLLADQHRIVGLYSGGTLAAEALWLLRQLGLSVHSNLDNTYHVDGANPHTILDLGAETFTRGRPHPMIDPQVRHQQLLALAEQSDIAVILCDVMLGWGSHAAPGVALAAAWQEFMQRLSKHQRQVIGIATVCGTADDPQNMAYQCQVLQEAGFLIADSNAQAVRLAAAMLGNVSEAVDTSAVLATHDIASTMPLTDSVTPAIPSHFPKLLAEGPKVINLGLEQFATQLKSCGVPVLHVDWQPPAGGDRRLAEMKVSSPTSPIDAANAHALERIFASRPFLTAVHPARDVIPELDAHTILHAGPPLDWQAMCGPLRGAILGVLQYEGWAANEAAGLSLIEGGKITFRPCHSASAVGPMTGLISPSMPLMVIENRAYGNRAYTTLNEGLGKVLRFGANDASVIERLQWLQAVAGPALDAALQRAKGIDLRVLMAQALLMGDEMHQRNVAATSLFARAILPHVVRVIDDTERLASLTDYLTGNDQFFLNLAMAAAKVTMDAASHIPACSLVTAMARNGTTFGVRVSALGERWFTAPVLMPRGLYFPGFSARDANPDIGDSAIVETLGLGAFAMAASPAVAQFVGVGGLSQARRYTEEMEEITAGRSPHLLLPTMDGQGVPTGIDIRQVIETGIVPWINTGIAHRQAGIGQIGAGVVQAPIDCFINALEAFAGTM